MVHAAPQQHSQPSRKGKRAWRKNVDLSEVETGLDEVRDETARGGVISERPSDALFAIDSTGSTAIKNAYKLHKPLRADEILAQRSAVPAVDTRKRAGVTDGIVPAKKRKGHGLTRSEYERLRARAYGSNEVMKGGLDTPEQIMQDPWEDAKEESEDEYPFLEKPKPIKEPGTLKHIPISMLARGKILPAVSKPKGATSYNPSFPEYQALLTAEEHHEAVAEAQRQVKAAAEAEKQALIEAAQQERDDISDAEDSAWEGFESERSESGFTTGKKLARRKTPAERNKIRRRKKAEQEERHLQRMRERDRQAKRLDEIAKEVRVQDARLVNLETATVSDPSDDEVDETILKRRKGKLSIPSKDLELVLPEELEDSLRRLKPEGNLLKERFRNYLLQGKVESRKPNPQRKRPRRTLTEKWTYKDFTIAA